MTQSRIFVLEQLEDICNWHRCIGTDGLKHNISLSLSPALTLILTLTSDTSLSEAEKLELIARVLDEMSIEQVQDTLKA